MTTAQQLESLPQRRALICGVSGQDGVYLAGREARGIRPQMCVLSLEHLVYGALGHFDLDWRQHVSQDPALLRPSDTKYGTADPKLAALRLGRRASMDVAAVVGEMCRATADSTRE